MSQDPLAVLDGVAEDDVNAVAELVHCVDEVVGSAEVADVRDVVQVVRLRLETLRLKPAREAGDAVLVLDVDEDVRIIVRTGERAHAYDEAHRAAAVSERGVTRRAVAGVRTPEGGWVGVDPHARAHCAEEGPTGQRCRRR